MPQSKFTPAQAEELAAAFAEGGVDYLFIGKSGAILLGYAKTLRDVDILLLPSGENAERVLSGPFALDLIHAPDGIESFAAGKSRRVLEDGRFPVASLDDIIASKRATGREKNLADVRRLEQFREEYPGRGQA